MKKILSLILSFVIVSTAFGQLKKYGDNPIDINTHSLPIVNGGTNIFLFKPTFNQSYVPILLASYATGAFPAIANAVAFNSDSLIAGSHQALWYSDAAATWHPLPIGGGSGGSTGTVTSIATNNGITGGTITTSGTIGLAAIAAHTYLGNNTASSAVPAAITTAQLTADLNLATLTLQGLVPAAPHNGMHLGVVGGVLTWQDSTAGCTTCIIQSGNAFGATMTIGTTDNNRIDFISNSAIKMSIFGTGDVNIGSSGTDPSVALGVNGTMKVGGNISTTANSGFSAGSGNMLSYLGQNNTASNIAHSFGLNNNFNIAGANKDFIAANGAVQMSSGTGETINQLHFTTSINNTGGSGHVVTFVLIDPTLTSITGTTINAFWNKVGNNQFNSTSGNSSFGGNVTITGSLSSGAVTTGYVEKAVDYAIAANDHIINLTSGSHTFTLPTAVGITGQEYIFKNTGGGTLTIATTSSQTVDGSAPGTVATVTRFVSTGANWITW
jgi:hypothetical protein